MHGTNLQRVARLARHLITQPRFVVPYLRTVPLHGQKPLDRALPWISFGAIDFIERYLRPDMTVFEWGSGGSTLYFAERVATVGSVESHGPWIEQVQRELAQRGLKNVTIEIKRGDFSTREAFRESPYFLESPKGPFDLILVDGYEEVAQVRLDCFYASEARIKPGGLIVVDDSWRYPELRERSKAKRFETFQSPGPCRYGVTSTDVFIY